jgi:hypothetical protein
VCVCLAPEELLARGKPRLLSHVRERIEEQHCVRRSLLASQVGCAWQHTHEAEAEGAAE